MKYDDARALIQNGDLVYVKNGTSIWSHLTEAVTGSPFYHCGIAFWIHDPAFAPHLMLLETHQGGRRIVTLSSYAAHEMEVQVAPIDWSTYGGAFMENTGVIAYSYLEYIAIGLWDVFRINVDLGQTAEVCSKLVALYLNQAGLELRTDISPADLYKLMVTAGTKTRCSITLDK